MGFEDIIQRIGEGGKMRSKGSCKAIKLLLSVVLISFLARPSAAADPEQKQYLMLKLGYYMPQHDDM